MKIIVSVLIVVTGTLAFARAEHGGAVGRGFISDTVGDGSTEKTALIKNSSQRAKILNIWSEFINKIKDGKQITFDEYKTAVLVRAEIEDQKLGDEILVQDDSVLKNSLVRRHQKTWNINNPALSWISYGVPKNLI